jgi:RNA polymerase sigma factor for flagellar operon FliA
MSTSARHDSVKAYRQAEHTKTGNEREQEVLRHLPLVHTVVDRVAAHLPSTVDRDDLFHAGVIGLIDALGRFDPSRDNAFSTYAVMRIRGQIIDELRARDWVSRGARERSREYHQAVSELMSLHGRMPSDAELAARLGVVEDELPAIEREAQLASQVSLDAPLGDEQPVGATIARPDDEAANPARHLERADRQRLVLEVLKTLAEQDRLVIKLYYFENLLMKEIAAVIGVTESRVCQIHSRVIAMLRTRLGSDDIFG